jgi:hypothetical protein
MKFYVTAEKRGTFRDEANVGDIKVYEFDFSPFATDISAVTWSIEDGDGTVSSQALVSNVASARISFTHECQMTVKLTAVSTTQGTLVVYMTVKVGDLHVADYE